MKSNIYLKLKDILPKDRFARNTTILSGGTLIGQGLVVVVSPLLTRLYNPADFGALAIFVSILSLLAGVVTLKYHLAIPLPESDDAAVNLLVLAMLIITGMTILSGLSLFLFGQEIIHMLSVPLLAPYLWIIPVSLIGAGMYQVLQYWTIRKQNFNCIARTKITQSAGMIATQIAFGLMTRGPLGLLLGDAVGRVGGSGALIRYFWSNHRALLKDLALNKIQTLAVRYKKFPLMSSLSGLVNSAGLQAAPILLASFYGATVVGWFALTQRIIGIPMQFIGLSVAQVYTSESAKLAREDPTALRRLFIEQTRKLAFIGGLPIIFIGLISPWFFGLIFGSAWDVSGKYAQIMSFMFAIQFVVVPLSQTLNVLERQQTQLMWDIGRLVLVVGGIFVCAKLHYSSLAAVLVYSLVMSVAYLALFLFAYRAIKKRLNELPI